jgi:hypothetical protein
MDRVRKNFASEVRYPKLLKRTFDAFRYALSNETTFKQFYHADLMNLPYLCKHILRRRHTVPPQKYQTIKEFQ